MERARRLLFIGVDCRLYYQRFHFLVLKVELTITTTTTKSRLTRLEVKFFSIKGKMIVIVMFSHEFKE